MTVPVPALFTTKLPVPDITLPTVMPPVLPALRVSAPVAAIPPVATVSRLEVVFNSVPPLAVTVKPRVYEAAAPVYDRVPPSRLTTPVPFPRLLEPAVATRVSTDTVPRIQKRPVKVLAPASVTTPGPYEEPPSAI